MTLVPLGDRVVLKQVEAEETTKSGIVLPGHGTWGLSPTAGWRKSVPCD